VIRLNNAVADAMTRGPRSGLALLDGLEPVDYRHDAARAHLLELAGDLSAAADAYRAAAARARASATSATCSTAFAHN
jgi:predicted RNA polymerase sigma factor